MRKHDHTDCYEDPSMLSKIDGNRLRGLRLANFFITPEALLEHWQGHRRLTRRVIDAFPEDKLFAFSIGGMRPFGALALEMLAIAVPMLRGIAGVAWDTDFSRDPRPKSETCGLGRAHRGDERTLGQDPAAAFPGNDEGIWPA